MLIMMGWSQFDRVSGESVSLLYRRFIVGSRRFRQMIGANDTRQKLD